MSENKCFCHLYGYEVKDAKARRDIEKLKNNGAGGKLYWHYIDLFINYASDNIGSDACILGCYSYYSYDATPITSIEYFKENERLRQSFLPNRSSFDADICYYLMDIYITNESVEVYYLDILTGHEGASYDTCPLADVFEISIVDHVEEV